MDYIKLSTIKNLLAIKKSQVVQRIDERNAELYLMKNKEKMKWQGY